MKIALAFRKWYLAVLFLLPLLVSSCTKEYFSGRHVIYNDGPTYNNPYHAEIPITISYLSQTDTRASISVMVNSVPISVLFDTGSWGLRVLNGAIPDVPLDTDTSTVTQMYTGGINFQGRVADAYLTFDHLKSTEPIKLQRIDAVSSGNGNYVSTGNAPMSNNTLTRTFNGIIGVGLRFDNKSYDIANPLSQMPGNGAFIIHFPKFQDGKQGVLILNPTNEERKGFTIIQLHPDSIPLPNGLNSWLDNQLVGVVTVDGVAYTNNTLLDSGNPADLYYNIKKNKHTIGTDTVITLSLANLPIATTFTTKNQISGQDLIAIDNSKMRNVFGIQFFFGFDVLYDQKNGLIGIRKRIN